MPTRNQCWAHGDGTIETADFSSDKFRDFGWRILFPSGQWSGWHTGYHSRLDALNTAKDVKD